MTKEEALKAFAYMGAVWFGNSKQHFAFSAYALDSVHRADKFMFN